MGAFAAERGVRLLPNISLPITMDDLKVSWTSDPAGLQFGREMYEHLAPMERVGWAASALQAIHDVISPIAEIEAALQIAESPARWHEAPDVFDALRQCSLQLPCSQPSELLQHAVLDVAETTAKIAYNASGAPAPFDANAGWQLAPRCRRVVELVASASLESRVWAALSQSRARAT